MPLPRGLPQDWTREYATSQGECLIDHAITSEVPFAPIEVAYHCTCGETVKGTHWKLKFDGPLDVGGAWDDPVHGDWLTLLVCLYAWGIDDPQGRLRGLQIDGLTPEQATTVIAGERR